MADPLQYSATFGYSLFLPEI